MATSISRRDFMHRVGAVGTVAGSVVASGTIGANARASDVPDPAHIRRRLRGWTVLPNGGDDHDNLEWALRNSGSQLAGLPEGSEAGLARLSRGEVVAAAIGRDHTERILLRGIDGVVQEYQRLGILDDLLLLSDLPLQLGDVFPDAHLLVRLGPRQLALGIRQTVLQCL